MYPVKPLYGTDENSVIDTEGIMYRVRPINSGTANTTQSEEVDLMARQEQLIENIKKQIQRVDALLDSQDSQSPPKSAASIEIVDIKNLSVQWPPLPYPIDIVISADPAKLPLIPWTFRKLLGDCVLIRTHRHSSYQGPEVSVENNNDNTNRTQGVRIIFTIIFRNVDDIEIMIDPINQTTIRGEGNLLRYLTRALPLCDELPPYEATQIDYFIDLIASTLLSQNVKEQENALKIIATHLENRGLLVAKKPTAADHYLFSALSKVKQTLPASVKSWHRNILQCYV